MAAQRLGQRRSRRQSLIHQQLRNIWHCSMRHAKQLQEFSSSKNSPFPLHLLILPDSQTAIDVADGTAINHAKTKHIDIRYHALRHYIQEGKVVVSHIPGADNIADLFTKVLPRPKHGCLVDCMGMRKIEEILE